MMNLKEFIMILIIFCAFSCISDIDKSSKFKEVDDLDNKTDNLLDDRYVYKTSKRILTYLKYEEEILYKSKIETGCPEVMNIVGSTLYIYDKYDKSIYCFDLKENVSHKFKNGTFSIGDEYIYSIEIINENNYLITGSDYIYTFIKSDIKYGNLYNMCKCVVYNNSIFSINWGGLINKRDKFINIFDLKGNYLTSIGNFNITNARDDVNFSKDIAVSDEFVYLANFSSPTIYQLSHDGKYENIININNDNLILRKEYNYSKINNKDKSDCSIMAIIDDVEILNNNLYLLIDNDVLTIIRINNKGYIEYEYQALSEFNIDKMTVLEFEISYINDDLEVYILCNSYNDNRRKVIKYKAIGRD